MLLPIVYTLRVENGFIGIWFRELQAAMDFNDAMQSILVKAMSPLFNIGSSDSCPAPTKPNIYVKSDDSTEDYEHKAMENSSENKHPAPPVKLNSSDCKSGILPPAPPLSILTQEKPKWRDEQPIKKIEGLNSPGMGLFNPMAILDHYFTNSGFSECKLGPRESCGNEEAWDAYDNDYRNSIISFAESITSRVYVSSDED